MFEQAFKTIDDVLRKEASCSSELDYTEQTSWLLFLKYLDGLEEDKATEAALNEARVHDGKGFRTPRTVFERNVEGLMALVKCAECQHDVSDKAAACPHCGAPIASPTNQSSPPAEPTQKVLRKGAKFEAIGFVLIVVGMLVLMAASEPTASFGTAAIVIGFIVFIIGRFM